MPYEPTNPPTAPAFVPANASIDEYFMQSVNIRLTPSDPTATEIDVVWLEGFTSSGQFVIAPFNAAVGGGGRKEATLSGPGLVTAMTQLVTPGKTIYDDFRDKLWVYMESIGLIPPGTVT